MLIAATVAGVAGLVIGGLGGFLLFGERGGSEDRGEQVIAEGCAVLERLEDEFPLGEDALALEDPLIFELGGAGQLFMAADRVDSELEPFSTAGRDLATATSRVDLAAADEAAAELLELCGAR
ncbi:hypothetical protein FM112_15570 [Gulosibacter sp. 10]|nr:hypothetical protein FM112_15570 [Gulosibacter sp. 10]